MSARLWPTVPTMFSNTKNIFYLFLLILAINIANGVDRDGEDAVEDFIKKEVVDIKPGGQVHTLEIAEGEFLCKFVYAAQGGTDENWLMLLEWRDADHSEISCRVDRPGGRSYLFFQQFELSSPSKRYSLAHVDLVDADSNTLDPEQYVVDNNSVKQNGDKFKNSLARVMLTLRRTATDEL